jgi:hypothetical protein
MTYRLVFDVSREIPEIAVGITATLLLVAIIAVGLWSFADFTRTWRLIAIASLALGLTELILGGSRAFLLPIVIGVVGTGIEALRGQVDDFAEFSAPPGSIAVVACSILLLLTAATGNSRFSAIELTNQLNSGKAEVLEGVVTEFMEVPTKQECFTVEHRRFCYSDSGYSRGFNRTRAYGGPMAPGLSVRVAAIGDTIVRIEIAEP